MAGNEVMSECQYGTILQDSADFRIHGCCKCDYLEESLKQTLSELISLQVEIGLLYTDLNSLHMQNEVRSQPVQACSKSSISPMWCSVKSKCIKAIRQEDLIFLDLMNR
jgi:hypothetical protein